MTTHTCVQCIGVANWNTALRARVQHARNDSSELDNDRRINNIGGACGSGSLRCILQNVQVYNYDDALCNVVVRIKACIIPKQSLSV